MIFSQLHQITERVVENRARQQLVSQFLKYALLVLLFSVLLGLICRHVRILCIYDSITMWSQDLTSWTSDIRRNVYNNVPGILLNEPLGNIYGRQARNLSLDEIWRLLRSVPRS